MTQANHPLCSDAQSNPWLVSPQSAGDQAIQRYEVMNWKGGYSSPLRALFTMGNGPDILSPAASLASMIRAL